MKTHLLRQLFFLIAAMLTVACTVHERGQVNDNDFKALLDKYSVLAQDYPDSALMILNELLPQQQGDDKAATHARILDIIGVSYNLKGKYDSAAHYLYEASRLAEKIKYDSLQMIVLSHLGILQFEMKNADDAVKYYQQSLVLSEKLKDSIFIAYQLNNIGNVYMTLNNEFEKAIPYFERCMEVSEKINCIKAYAVAGINLAQIYNELGEHDKALQKIKRITEQYGENNYASFTVGEIYYKKGDYEKAIHEWKEILTKNEQFDSKEFEYAILNKIADAYKVSGNSDSSLVYLEKSYALKDVLHDLETDETINKLKIAYETEKKEMEIERQQQVISRQNLQRAILVAGVAVCAIILALLWFMLRLRSRRNHALSERNDALTEMNATKDKFFSIISHDLRNPAIAQRDALQLLVQNGSRWDVDRLTSYYRDLLKSADGQVELLFNLLGWAQVQTGRMTYAPETFILTDALTDLPFVRKMAANKGVAFSSQIPGNAIVAGDRNMLAMVIRNLLINAVKFTPAGGEVMFDVSPACGEIPAGYTISISDTGIGMTEEQTGKLFRLDSARSRKGTAGEQGSGLGLIVCRELLEKHGSELHVESEEGKGSRFWFELRSKDVSTAN